MKALILRQYGEHSPFEEIDLPRPAVLDGHLLIRVAATSVNPVDYKIRLHGPNFAPELPAVLHGDVAGYVEEVGANVSGFQRGDEVFACAGGVNGMGGALAEFMLADAALVARKPSSLNVLAAAALPLVSITAWESLIDRAQLAAGQTVLVHGGTGGVGHIGVQLAKWAGCQVFATVSSARKAQLVLELGADRAIDYRSQSVADYVRDCTGGKGFDVVFDTVGGEHLAKSFEAAAIGGVVSCISTRTAVDLSAMHAKNLSLHVIFMLLPMLRNMGREHHGEILTQVATLVDSGQLCPLVDERTFSFADVLDAHEYLVSGKAIGKVVLRQDCW
ncbi:MAG: zinc-dependent alcohol dehydrogenase family protein [Cyanobacteria bacterium J06597_1]